MNYYFYDADIYNKNGLIDKFCNGTSETDSDNPIKIFDAVVKAIMKDLKVEKKQVRIRTFAKL